MRMHSLYSGAFLILIVLASGIVQGAVGPSDVVVVYNRSPIWEDATGQNISEAVARYYCNSRHIPEGNLTSVDLPFVRERLEPQEFASMQAEIKSFLLSRAGVDPVLHPDQVPDLAADPTKCIVLCYGVPIMVEATGRRSSVDSNLSLLLNGPTPWGRETVGAPAPVANPYYENTIDPDQRAELADFGAFRQTGRQCESTQLLSCHGNALHKRRYRSLPLWSWDWVRR